MESFTLLSKVHSVISTFGLKIVLLVEDNNAFSLKYMKAWLRYKGNIIDI